MAVEFQQVEIRRDHDRLVDFLCNDEWPFHAQRRPTADDIEGMEFASPDVASFWVVSDSERAGLIRLLDLDDIGEGAPLFDLRIGSRHRGRGLGLQATRWIVDYLFDTYPKLHRIEANTRHDNAGMQRVLATAGFTSEGRLREAWIGEGQLFDTMVYGILRTDGTVITQTSRK